MAGIERLLEVAGKARTRAYAPYSGFRVGAALETGDGSIFSGCNVENASFGLTLCAERAAVAAAVAGGRRDLRRIVVVSDGPEPIPPCGACRSVLAELAPGMEVVSEAGGGRAFWSLEELLPLPFHLPARDGGKAP